MSNLTHLIYASAAVAAFPVDELAELLQRARANNSRLGITGVLLFSEGNFFQVLEGEPVMVDALFHHIRRDPRHDQLVEIIREPIARRSFDSWSMGFLEMRRTELDAIEGAELVGGIDSHGPRQAIMRAIIGACTDLGIDVIAEGVETAHEFEWLAGQGVELFQGYYFARPAFEAFPAVDYHAPH